MAKQPQLKNQLTKLHESSLPTIGRDKAVVKITSSNNFGNGATCFGTEYHKSPAPQRREKKEEKLQWGSVRLQASCSDKRGLQGGYKDGVTCVHVP
jgi:hypothetical protein